MHGVDPAGEVMSGDDHLGRAHTPFEQPWWLDAVAPGSWGEVVVERQGEPVARLPYVRKRKLGFTVLTQPPLTRFVGPWLRPSTGKYAKQLGVECELMGELIKQLPPHDVYRGSFAPAVTNWLPFYWAGFEATVRYTYRLNDLSDPDKLWAEVGGNVRSRVRRAQDQVEIRTDVCLDDVLRINRMLFERQGLSPPFDDDTGPPPRRRLSAARCAADRRRRRRAGPGVFGAVPRTGRHDDVPALRRHRPGVAVERREQPRRLGGDPACLREVAAFRLPRFDDRVRGTGQPVVRRSAGALLLRVAGASARAGAVGDPGGVGASDPGAAASGDGRIGVGGPIGASRQASWAAPA